MMAYRTINAQQLSITTCGLCCQAKVAQLLGEIRALRTNVRLPRNRQPVQLGYRQVCVGPGPSTPTSQARAWGDRQRPLWLHANNAAWTIQCVKPFNIARTTRMRGIIVSFSTTKWIRANASLPFSYTNCPQRFRHVKFAVAQQEATG